MQGTAKEPIYPGAGFAFGSRRCHASALVISGFVAAALSATAAGWVPALDPRPWLIVARAAGEPGPLPLDYVVTAFGAIRANEVLWPVLALAITGGVAGALARYVVPNSRVGGSAGSVFLGIFAAAMGGWACQRIGAPLPADVSLLNIGVAFTVAVAMLFVGKLIARL